MAEQVEVEVTVSRTRTILESYTVSFPVAKDAELYQIHEQAYELANEDPTGWVDPFGGRTGLDNTDDTEYEYEILNEDVLEPKKEE